jgi:hypothetical protein
MPSRSFLSVTQGSGTKMGTATYTDGADTKHDEVVVFGEQHLATYTVTTTAGGTSVATNLSHFCQLMAGSTLHVYVRRIRVTQFAVATTAALVPIVVTRLTTAGTGGTTVTPSPLDTGDSAAGATAMTLPTVKGTNGATIWADASYFVQTVSASLGVPQPAVLLDLDFSGRRSKGLRIPAGTANGIALQNNAAVAGATVLTVIEFSEAPY